MADDTTIPVQDDRTTEAPRKRRRWPLILLGAVVVLPALVFALWTAVALNWSYSKGERVGYVLKFSQKGWLCKTWEGELSMATVPGVAPEKWAFSVRDDGLARRLQSVQGQQVALVYEQHKGVPSACFGDTEYFVTDVKPVGAAAPVVTPAPIPPNTPVAPGAARP